MPLKISLLGIRKARTVVKQGAGGSSGKKQWEHWLLKLILNLASETYIPKAIPTAAQMHVFFQNKSLQKKQALPLCPPHTKSFCSLIQKQSK